jgi:hypothetical protein
VGSEVVETDDGGIGGVADFGGESEGLFGGKASEERRYSLWGFFV